MDILEHIDAYFNGEPTPEEASQFEKRVLQDPTFANEVADYLRALAATREANTQEQKQRFRELYRQQTQAPKWAEVHKITPRTRKWLTLAAAAAVLATVALTWLLYLRPADPSKLADRYIRQNLTILPLKMGATDPMQTGISLYNSGQFAKAARQFEELLRTDSLNPAALINTGIVSLHLGEYDNALECFTKLQKHTDPHVNPALFYEAITLMRRNNAGDADHAKQILMKIVREDGNRKQDAQELLSKM
jgi:tetratricopeptide (TPR) repeat protein